MNQLILNKNDKYLYCFLMMYIFSTAYTGALILPIVNRRLQLTELLFIPIFLIGFRYLFELKKIEKLKRWYFLLPILYVFINLFSSFYSQNLFSIIESFGKIYLLILYLITILFFERFELLQIKKFIFLAVSGLNIFLIVNIFLGLVLWQLGIQNEIGAPEWYPYLGFVYRTSGFTCSPSMLLSVINITITITFAYFLEKKSKLDLVFVGLLLLGGMLTLTKSIILILMNLVLLFCYNRFKNNIKRLNFVVISICLIALNLVTHLMVIPKNFDRLDVFSQKYISDKIVFSTEKSNIYETCYAATKHLAIQIFTEKPILGIGNGNFQKKTNELRVVGYYPPKLDSYDPHCTYTGALAENGFLGAVSILLFLGFLVCFFNKNKFKTLFEYAIYLIFISILTEAMIADVLNFRHYWIFFALFVAVKLKEK